MKGGGSVRASARARSSCFGSGSRVIFLCGREAYGRLVGESESMTSPATPGASRRIEPHRMISLLLFLGRTGNDTECI